MKPALLGTKIGMTRVIGEGGAVTPVTVVKAGPCIVLQVKSTDTDGYDAVQLGFADVKPHRSTKPIIGHCAVAKTGPKRFIREVRLDDAADVGRGEVLTVELFREGVGHVDVRGTTKGKGYAGVMKRHGFGGMSASHGTERKHRSPGGIGASGSRGRGRCIKKGKRMGGQMGDVRCAMTNLKLVGIDADNDLLLIAGSVPGPNGGTVLVEKSKKRG
ncbi:MAG: 50S ribosomal protein L3 [Phycisphaerae bacterium]|nr:50S ribosomal protein L3 [Phycisphaerae bacterium]